MNKILTTYLAGYIEASPESAFDWRDKAYESLYNPQKLIVYDPIRQEASKTGKKAGSHVQYVTGLKKAGRYEQFDNEMDKIWLGNIKRTFDLARLFKLLRDRALVDGNKEEELKWWGDYEAVARSDFIIAFMKKDIQTIGTIGEIFEAMLLNIPVYLIIDSPKTETNSTLLYWVRFSGGEIFYKLEDCIKFINEKYKLNN
ncbi:MAG: hypothetical protein ACTSPD_10095 [Promethearchaeota archaeon]